MVNTVTVPGLARLFSELAVDAADADHPARAFFGNRDALVIVAIRSIVQRAQAEGSLDPDVDPDSFTQLFIAVLDGLQMQWLRNPSVDMNALVETYFHLLQPSTAPA